jgi:hypothetical protein
LPFQIRDLPLGFGDLLLGFGQSLVAFDQLLPQPLVVASQALGLFLQGSPVGPGSPQHP